MPGIYQALEKSREQETGCLAVYSRDKEPGNFKIHIVCEKTRQDVTQSRGKLGRTSWRKRVAQLRPEKEGGQ